MAAKSTRTVRRCAWASSDPLMQDYHDHEWGVPERDSRALWEKLMLDGFQAGLSWSIILRKRAAFRRAFRNFDPKQVARFGAKDIARLLRDPGIVRSRRWSSWTPSDVSAVSRSRRSAARTVPSLIAAPVTL